MRKPNNFKYFLVLNRGITNYFLKSKDKNYQIFPNESKKRKNAFLCFYIAKYVKIC